MTKEQGLEFHKAANTFAAKGCGERARVAKGGVVGREQVIDFHPNVLQGLLSACLDGDVLHHRIKGRIVASLIVVDLDGMTIVDHTNQVFVVGPTAPGNLPKGQPRDQPG